MDNLLILRFCFSILEILLFTVSIVIMSKGTKDEVLITIPISITLAVGISILIPFMGIIGYVPAMILIVKSYTHLSIGELIKNTIIITTVMLLSNVAGVIFASILKVNLKTFNPYIAILTLSISTIGYLIIIKEKTNAFSLDYWQKK